MKTVLSFIFIFSLIILLPGCKLKNDAINNFAFTARKKAILDKYPKIPNEAILMQMNNMMLYGELKEKYRKTLTHLKAETDEDCAKMIVAIVSPEVGKNISITNSYGIPFIIDCCNEMGIDVVDLSQEISEKEPFEITFIPYDGTWNKPGAAYMADLISENIIEKYTRYMSTKQFRDLKFPETFGDLPPNEDEVLQDEKNISYHVKANSQGLRMNHNLKFQKTMQRILLLGGTQIFQPYLDNEFTTTALIQNKYPNKEIINAAKPNYSLDDFETLYIEKARYTQPDLVIIVTNGKDILDYYFTARNNYTRSKQIYMPSDNEINFYHFLYEQKRDQ